MVEVAQGDIWWATTDKRRPVLVVTRSEAASVLSRVVVAPITRTIRGIPTEIRLGPDEGLPDDCVASFDNLQAILKDDLTERSGRLAMSNASICQALAALADC